MKTQLRDRRFQNDWTVEQLEEIYSDITHAVAVPVNVKVKVEHRILDLGSMEKILSGAETIAIQGCDCRIHKGNCNAPLETCINLDEAGESLLESGKHNPRRITLEEALDALRISHEAGLVHMAYTMEEDDRPKIICSCCTCCCHTLSGLLRFGIARHVLRSEMISVTDTDACTNSGVCVKRCHFGARKLVDSKMVYDPDQCFGCGLCVSTCPANAITLEMRS
jgi:NAD-dependent dihydropyrimidine dehydrogenase PreA subunit